MAVFYLETKTQNGHYPVRTYDPGALRVIKEATAKWFVTNLKKEVPRVSFERAMYNAHGIIAIGTCAKKPVVYWRKPDETTMKRVYGIWTEERFTSDDLQFDPQTINGERAWEVDFTDEELQKLRAVEEEEQATSSDDGDNLDTATRILWGEFGGDSEEAARILYSRGSGADVY